MGETPQPVTASFNRSLRIESRVERLTGDRGAVLVREILERSGIVGWMAARLKDPRSQGDVTHDLASLLRTSVLLSAQGWRDHDDACALRHDPAFRLASRSAAGLSPLGGPGLASQPTLSRFAALLELAGRGIRAERGGNKMACVTLDVDSAPIEVHGHQPKAEWTGRGRASATWPWCALMRVFLRQPCWRALRHAGSTMSRVCAPTRPQDPV